MSKIKIHFIMNDLFFFFIKYGQSFSQSALLLKFAQTPKNAKILKLLKYSLHFFLKPTSLAFLERLSLSSSQIMLVESIYFHPK